MTKGNLFATSFVGAIPAGFLAYFSIMAFLNFSENMASMLQVLNGVTVLFSVLMALSPLAILIFMRGAAKEEVAAAGAATAAVSAAASAAGEPAMSIDEDLSAESVEEMEGESHSTGDEDDLSLSGFESEPEPTSAASDEAFEFDDSGFEFEDDDLK